jgi:hypothetical protein
VAGHGYLKLVENDGAGARLTPEYITGGGASGIGWRGLQTNPHSSKTAHGLSGETPIQTLASARITAQELQI